MSGKNGNTPKLDLDSNLPQPRVINLRRESPTRSAAMSPTSPRSSCGSNEFNEDGNRNYILEYSNNPEAISLVPVGCPHCLMYVMLSKGDLKCPKCKSMDLIHFLNDNNKPTKKRG